MKKHAKTKRITVRLPDSMSESIRHLVDIGTYENLTELVLDALTRLLKENTNRGRSSS